MTGLTPVQTRTLAFIRDFIAEKGWPPSFDEIGKGIGKKSKSDLSRVIACLADRGVITYTPRIARSIRLVEQPRPAADLSFLDQHLETWVRVVAARAGREPLQVVNECVRDGYRAVTGRTPNETVSRENSGRPGTRETGEFSPDRPALAHVGGQ